MLHFPGEKRFFTVLEFGLQLTEDDNILLQNRLGEPFCCILHCWKELNPFKKFSCFMSITFNVSLSSSGSGPPLGWNLDWNGSCLRQKTEELSLKQPFLSVSFLITFAFETTNLGGGSLKCYQNFSLIVVYSFYWSHCKAKVCTFLRENLFNQNMNKSI